MNVFVLCTGRCGSTTFARACEYITNYSAAHESRVGKPYDRVEYPVDHIEVDNRLSWFLGRLDRRCGGDAFYVHLKRNREAVAESFARRYDRGIIKAYRGRILGGGGDDDPTVSPLDVCKHYWDTVNSNIDLFLKDKPRSMEFWLESAEDNFQEFWRRIGAEGDRSAALAEWNRKYNASDPAETPENDGPSPLPVRMVKKAIRVARELPTFLKRV